MNDVMGHIVDISATGMRVLSDRSLDTDNDYLLYVDLSEVEGFGQDVAFNAKCVWVRQDEDSGAYYCGMQLQDIGVNEQEIINRLIESLKDS